MRLRSVLVATFVLLLAGAIANTSETAAENVKLYDDLGTLEHPITTDSSEAQAYFNQGLRLGFGFWWEEAARSYKEATRLDPDAAMAYWGVALALGPYVNDPVGLDPEAPTRPSKRRWSSKTMPRNKSARTSALSLRGTPKT